MARDLDIPLMNIQDEQSLKDSADNIFEYLNQGTTRASTMEDVKNINAIEGNAVELPNQLSVEEQIYRLNLDRQASNYDANIQQSGSPSALVNNVASTSVEIPRNSLEDEVSSEVVKVASEQASDANQGSLKSKFLEAITYFAPQIGGTIIGGALGGSRGVAAGFETGTAIRSQLDNFDKSILDRKLKAERLALDKTKEGRLAVPKLQKADDLIDIETGETLSFDPRTGQMVNQSGQVVPVERQKNLRVEREERLESQGNQRINISLGGLDLRERQLEDKMDEDRTKKITTFIRSVESNKVYQEAEKAVGETQTIRALVEDARTKGGQSLAMLGPRIAKGIAGEVGVLTEQDVTRYLENPAIVPRVADKISKALGGRLTNNSAENILRLLDIMEEKNRAKMEDVMNKKSRVYGGTSSDVNPEQLKTIISGQSDVPSTPNKVVNGVEYRKVPGGWERVK